MSFRPWDFATCGRYLRNLENFHRQEKTCEQRDIIKSFPKLKLSLAFRGVFNAPAGSATWTPSVPNRALSGSLPVRIFPSALMSLIFASANSMKALFLIRQSQLSERTDAHSNQ
uniref:Uncharacterized protein n=1 Tax=Glossina pallidipes TaxID=7398 RepID=A0A1B0A6Q1_GLOPL